MGHTKQECPLLKKQNNKSKNNDKAMNVGTWNDSDHSKNKGDHVMDMVSNLSFKFIEDDHPITS